ncbi:MAG: hypothetical protein MK066_06255 [Crocinitomicaceae bacterium]|nr:hypothetical protein [Crocinitomicaceae bacterium]
MTLESNYIELFQSRLIKERKAHGVTFRAYENRINHVRIPKLTKISMAITAEGNQFIEDIDGGKFYNIFEFSSFSDVEPEVREWAANPNGNNYTYTDAIVIDSLSQKILADFYLRINQPVRPTRIFYSLEKAIAWTLEQIKRNQSI